MKRTPKDLARLSYLDLPSDQGHEGFPESSSYIYGYVNGYEDRIKEEKAFEAEGLKISPPMPIDHDKLKMTVTWSIVDEKQGIHRAYKGEFKPGQSYYLRQIFEHATGMFEKLKEESGEDIRDEE